MGKLLLVLPTEGADSEMTFRPRAFTEKIPVEIEMDLELALQFFKKTIFKEIRLFEQNLLRMFLHLKSFFRLGKSWLEEKKLLRL